MAERDTAAPCPSPLLHVKAPCQDDLQCPQCGRIFKHAASLANHKKTHEVGSFQCPVCTRTLPNAVALKNHLRIHTLSPSSVPAEEEAEPSEERHFGLSLNCGDNASPLHDTHRNASPEPEDAWDRPFKCDQCDRTYRHHGSLANHKKCHQEGDFECGVCLKHFVNLAALHTHERSHKYKPIAMVSGGGGASGAGGTGPQSDCFCHLCQVSLPNKSDFQEHLLLHNTAPSAGVTRSFGLMPHAAVRSPGYAPALGDPLPLPPLPPPPSDKRPYDPIMGPAHSAVFTCAYCGSAHPDMDSLKAHYLTHESRPTHSDPRPTHGQDLMSDGSQSSGASPGGRAAPGSSPEDLERRFKCGECGKSYRHAGSLVNHKRCHQTGQYQCSVCGKQYPHLAALHSHLRSHRGRSAHAPGADGDWLSSEPIMEQSYAEGGALQEGGNHFSQGGALDPLEFHERFEGPLQAAPRQSERQVCTDCGQVYGDVKTHLCSSRQAPQGNLSNGFNMNYSAPPPAGLKEDTARFAPGAVKRLGPGDKDDEDDGEIYQCSVCGNHYASLRALRSHLRSHANNPAPPGPAPPGPVPQDQGWRLICATCGQSFGRKQDLLNHQLSHGPQREVKGHRSACVDCGLFFSDRQLLASHACPGKSRLNGKDSTGGAHESRRAPLELSDKPHRCEQCGRGYRHPCSLLNHKKSHKTGVFRCLVCQKRYYNLLALKNHQRTHFDLKRHKCEECGKAFKIQKQLINHLRLHEEHRAKGLVRSAPSGARFPQAGPSQLHMLRADAAKGPAALGFKKPYSSAGTSRPQKFDAVESSRRPFSCEECGKTYRHAGSLANHKNLHKIGDYHCNVCNSTYPNRLAMKNHLRLHFAHKKHNCPDCGKGFRTQRQLATHSAGGLCKGAQGPGQPMDFECDGCCEGFSTADELSAHDCPAAHLPSGSAPSNPREERAPSEDSDERPYVCDLCNCAYKHASSLLNHKHTHKTGDFRCSFCDKPYTNYMALRNHMRIHTQRKKHVCHVCGKAFRLARFLRNHHRVHEEGATPYGCPSCGKSFQGRSALARHRCGDASSAPGSATSDGQDARRKAPGEPEECRYTCEECGRSYRHASSLLNHRHTHRVGVFQCGVCPKTFCNLLALKNHRRIHSEARRHLCPDCGKAFRVSSQLFAHRRVHLRQSALTCRPCCRAFPTLAGYSLHMELSHGRPRPLPPTRGVEGAERPYACEQCGRSYRHASSLLNHRNSHRMGAFSCGACHKQFKNLMSLKNHRRIHTEPRRHLCPDCGKAFRVSSQLLCHRRIHTREKPFTCQHCDRCFSSRSNLRHHAKVHWSAVPPPPPAVPVPDYMGMPTGPFL
ncbi:zinc finger protein 646 isoform X2 [Periophthalmus magnuspinnatus]|uniref:zinc finger protein 646 isoform X2 n=1 Tax=Periophthalmus magnuspinnatus TaxID=409849 RepID=UPI00243635C9|nr:zinc finger protein 646 isoform X2 [Periophthalmus magnuspinnatus]